MESTMTMTYESITPEIAKSILKNTVNRRVSTGSVRAYANDMKNGNWDENVGSAISIDVNGNLVDGQHRLLAVVQSNETINMWVCRNVKQHGVYDNNRKRTISDQIGIVKPELEKIYKSTRYVSVAKMLITHLPHENVDGYFRAVTPREVIDYTEAHKKTLDGFWLRLSQMTVAKISVKPVLVGLYLAYIGGVDMNTIDTFYEILRTGMGTKQEDFPIVAYRNYLKDSRGINATDEEVSRCQYALKKYMSGACTRSSKALKKLIWEYPKE